MVLPQLTPRSPRRRAGAAVVAALALSAAGLPLLAAPAPAATGGRAVRWIVSDPDAVRAAKGEDRVDFQRTVTVPASTTRAQLRARFPGAQVEPDTIDTITGSSGGGTEQPTALTAAPSDDRLPEQWSLQAPTVDGGGADVLGALGTATGRGMVVAVIDTGIRTESGEFAGRVLPGWDMVSDASAAHDGDGRDGDASDPGDWDPSTGEPSSWHGTHVAGIALAGADNGGVVGAAPEALLLPVRAVGAGGGLSSDITDAITWAVGGHVDGAPDNTHPAQVVNLSLGGTGACPAAYQNAIDLARSRGAVIVVSAGNNGADAATQRPANCAGVIVVAATDQYGERAGYSNFGAGVTLAAPGGDGEVDDEILSVVDAGTTVPVGPAYAAYEGTSMAAPLVAGAIADLKELHPALTSEAVDRALRATASPFRGSDSYYSCRAPLPCGAGLLDVAALVAAPPVVTVPAAPVLAAPVATTSTLALTWTPGSDGGSVVTDHLVQYSGNGIDWTTYAHPPTAATSATLTGLAPGTALAVRVAAVNAAGTGAFSAPVTASTSVTVPDAPSGLQATGTATGLVLTWTPGGNGGSPVVDHLTQVSSDGTTWQTVAHAASAAPTTTVTGLQPGTSYQARVALVNAAGPGPFGAAVLARTAAPAPVPTPVAAPAPARAPVAPSRLSATARSATSLLLRWRPGSNGGAPLTDVVVQIAGARGGWHTVAHKRSAAATLVVSGLRPGTPYRLRVALRNRVGVGPFGSAVPVRTPWVTTMSPTTAKPATVRRGATVSLSSRLTYRQVTATGTRTKAAAGAVLVVEFDPAGRAGLRAVAKVRTGKDGRVTYRLHVTGAGTVRFHELGAGVLAPALSRAAAVKVR